MFLIVKVRILEAGSSDSDLAGLRGQGERSGLFRGTEAAAGVYQVGDGGEFVTVFLSHVVRHYFCWAGWSKRVVTNYIIIRTEWSDP